MRKMKRLIALVTVAMFLISFAAPAAAATKEEAFGRLNALNVAVGDATGNPQYDKTFTRAEAAAIMVNLLGMKAAIDSAKGATKFSDVPASHWASGVINLAVGAGVIKGYGDGTYKPDKEVTYAELCAMLVQVLGYSPKLQGVWPSNVVGKAAQLGLLDGVSVSDVNSPAVRSNVFLAADKALAVKPLKETKDGYEEDTKTLMESKLSVTKKTEGTVTQVPMISGTKNKVTLDYTKGATVTIPSGQPTNETLDVLATIDSNPTLGLNCVAWVKDDKVFFLDVKTTASDIINDSIKAIDSVTNNPGATAQTITAGKIIKADKADREFTVAASPTIYKNYSTTAPTVSVGDTVKMILDANGKVKTLLAFSYTRRMVDSVSTTSETITFKGDGAPGGSITLKDKVAIITKDGKAIGLADLQKGNIVDYFVNGNNNYIVVSDKSVSGKLTSVAENGLNASNEKKFKVTIAGTEYKLVGAAGSAYYSIDDGKNYTVINTASDLGSVLNQEVKAVLNKDGSVAYINAGAASAANEIIAFVRHTKLVDVGEMKRYLYVTKADGTNVYYEVTKDAKIDGATINEDILKNQGTAGQQFQIATTGFVKVVVANEVIKLTLTSDGKVDNMKKYTESDVLNSTHTHGTLGSVGTFVYTAVGIAVDKNADSINVNTTGALAVNADTKIFKAKTAVGPNGTIDDAEMTSWTAVEALSDLNKAATSAIVIKDGGVAKVVVIYNLTAQFATASDYKYGALAEIGNDGKDYLKINEGATDPTKKEGTAGTTAIEDLVRFKVSSTDKFTDVTAVTAETADTLVYTYFKINSIITADKQLKLVHCDVDGNENPDGTYSYKFYDPAKVKVFDISGTNSVVYVADLATASGTVVKIYNAYDKDGKDLINGGDPTDQVMDFISIVHK
jgi:hypothetical protein